MGAWIEIENHTFLSHKDARRTPRWVRGLKYELQRILFAPILSHPTMGAWIEIFEDFVCYFKHEVAAHDGCVD